MRRTVDFIHMECQMVEAVWCYRIRSFILLLIALAVPLMSVLTIEHMLMALPVPGWSESIESVLPVLALVATLKLLFLTLQVYLRDRAKLLEF